MFNRIELSVLTMDIIIMTILIISNAVKDVENAK